MSKFKDEMLSSERTRATTREEFVKMAKDAFAAYQEGIAAAYDEMDTLNVLAQDARDSGMNRDQFEELLRQTGYDPRRAKVQASNSWELLNEKAD